MTLAGHIPTESRLYSRVALQTACLTGVVMVTSYSASLLSYIMTSTDELPINSFQDLLSDGSYQLRVMEHSAHLTYFKARSLTSFSFFVFLLRSSFHPQLSFLPSFPVSSSSH
jgi:hypothetical protein